jgi:hypothetical protein
VGSKSPRRSRANRSASTRSFLRRAAAMAFVCLGFDRMAWWPKRSTRSTNHHQVPDASMATRAPRGTWAKNRSSCRGSFSSRCCVTSPSGINTASCELRLCKSTPTCTIASVSFRRVGLASGRAYSRTPREANALMASSGCGPPQRQELAHWVGFPPGGQASDPKLPLAPIIGPAPPLTACGHRRPETPGPARRACGRSRPARRAQGSEDR